MKGYYYGNLQKNFRRNMKYHEKLYSKFNNIDEFDKFLEIQIIEPDARINRKV